MAVELLSAEHTDASEGNGEASKRLPALMKKHDLDEWRSSVKSTQDCHYDTAASLNRHHYATGIPLVVLSAIAASSIMTDAETLGIFGSYSKLIGSGVGLLVTALAAMQAFLGFEKRAGLHYKAGAQYGALKREIDLKRESGDDAWLSPLSERWNVLTEESPIIPLRIWRRNGKAGSASKATSLARAS
jgi:hypothetical protein